MLSTSCEVKGPLVPVPRDPRKSSKYTFVHPTRENIISTAYFRRSICLYINHTVSSIRLWYERIPHIGPWDDRYEISNGTSYGASQDLPWIFPPVIPRNGSLDYPVKCPEGHVG